MTKRKFLAQEMFQHVARWRESGTTTVDYAKQIGSIHRSKRNYFFDLTHVTFADKNDHGQE